MAVERDLTLSQGNDETIDITITAVDPAEDLTGIDIVRVYIKPDTCTSDDDAETLILTSGAPSQVVILSQTASLITAEAFVPGAYLAEPYPRVWRVDAIGPTGEVRTALYGSVTVLDT